MLIFIICFPAITLGPSTIRAIIGRITSFAFWWKTITTWTSNFHRMVWKNVLYIFTF